MKKILCLTFVLVAISSSSFARTILTTTGAVTVEAATIYAGTDQASLDLATNPTAKLSTGVQGVAVYSATGYSINAKHKNGSKVFGTANDATNVYWKASASKTAITTAESAQSVGDAAYSTPGNGWTSY